MEVVMIVSMRYYRMKYYVETLNETHIDIVGFANIFQSHMIPIMKRIEISSVISPIISNDEVDRIVRILIQRKLPVALRAVCPEVELYEAMVETIDEKTSQKHEWRI